jgi:diguanylate cyclase (GGDEF)-like protein
MPDTSLAAYESLVQFLYQAPIGLVQTALDGEILMINPMSAQLLMPLARNGDLLNLFDVLSTLAPELRELGRIEAEPGTVLCDALHLTLPEVAGRRDAPRTLSLQLLRLDEASLMCTLSDVTGAVQREQQRLATRLHAATRTDSLTDLPNRLALLETVDAALGRMQRDEQADVRWSVLLVNLDRFERINVTLGQAIGDAVLHAAAGRMRALSAAAVPPLGDAQPGVVCMVARFGGDEFVLLLREDAPGTSPESGAGGLPAAVLARRLLESLGAPYPIGDVGGGIRLTASVGTATASRTHRHAVAVMQDARLAMREAKRAGGARASAFEPRMLESAWKRGSVEADLRRALDENQLFVVYQPIVRLDGSGAIAGMEALVRWRHPTRGVVPPNDFIGIAEETGLIVMLGEFVLRQACAQLAHWQGTLGAQAPGSMSVNLSRAQVMEPSIVDTVARALADCGLDAGALQLEVTESLAAQDQLIRQRLDDLKALGLTLALDDFGTGYSSLASLHLMPIDVVKIDRSFVSQSVTSAHHRVLIEAVSKVARSLGMSTVAEGIETAAQGDVLAALDCDKGQGYFYARPLPADEAEAWLRARPAPGQGRDA